MQVGFSLPIFSDSSEFFVKLATCNNQCHPMTFQIIPVLTAFLSYPSLPRSMGTKELLRDM